MTRHLLALAGATALLIALPWLVLGRKGAAPPPPAPIDDHLFRPAAAAPIDSVLDRDPFHAGDEARAAEPPAAEEEGGPPEIVGIAGRLPDRAVVLVRRAGGGVRTLAVGEAIGRWRLRSIAPDAVLFEDGGRRARVELPIADAP